MAKNTATPDGSLEVEHLKVYSFPIELSRARENVALLSVGFGLWLSIRLRRGNYALVIACGIRGLFVVGVLASFVGVKYGYNSLELYSGPRYECGLGRWFKRLERRFNQRACFSIIQDSKRAELLSRINGLGSQIIALFPNAPYQSGEGSVKDSRDNLLRHLGIPETARLVVYSGSLQAPWSGVGKILASVSGFPNGHILFLQTRSSTSTDFCDGIEDLCSSGKLLVSNSPLSAEAYDRLVQGAEVGIAWYESDDENIRFAGLSSGKVAHYLRWGKPVVINRLPLFTEIIEKYHCGVVVDNAGDIGAALEEISVNYTHYSAGALTAYSELFDMDKHARNLIEQIEVIMRAEQ